jgi:hypothetical protein
MNTGNFTVRHLRPSLCDNISYLSYFEQIYYGTVMTFITENFSKCNVAYCTPFTNFCRDDACDGAESGVCKHWIVNVVLHTWNQFKTSTNLTLKLNLSTKTDSLARILARIMQVRREARMKPVGADWKAPLQQLLHGIHCTITTTLCMITTTTTNAR